MHYLRYKRPLYAPFKYVLQWVRTWYILFRQQYTVVYVTNPPIFAALCVALACLIMRTAYIMDTHSPALYSLKWSWTVPLQRLVARGALVNIVDQDRYRHLFERWQARAFVMERPPVSTELLRTAHAAPLDESFSITVVNTFAVDEPLEPVLDAARMLPDVRFDILGDVAKAPSHLLDDAPNNVFFLGYLHKTDYWSQLGKCHAVMALTTYPHSLLGGAQEGLAAGKPLILSRQPALEEYFYRGTVFTDHTAESVVGSVQAVQEREAQLRDEISELYSVVCQSWNMRLAELWTLIEAQEAHSR